MSTVIRAEGAAAAVPEKASRLTRQRVRSAWLFMAPMLVVLALVAGWPLLRTMWFGFTDANLADLEAAEFIGFVNYSYLLTDPDWWNAVWNTLVFTSVSLALETILGMAIALYKTLVGSVLNVWLMANYRLLEAGTVHLVTGMIERGEENAWF